MVFIDLYTPGIHMPVDPRLELKTAPGNFTLLVSSNRQEVRKQRETCDLVAAIPKNANDLTTLLVETAYDFFIIPPEVRPGKRGIRMARRYETPLAVPLAQMFSLNTGVIARTRRNLLRIQEFGGPLILCSGAQKSSDLRTGRDLAAIAMMLGVNQQLALKAVNETPEWLVNRSQERMKQVAWGVEEVHNEK
ncbi:MAG TPA: hypothetical protein ENN60_02555 [archaeon]|nr:hypothetical protein [archaeon]